MGKTFKGKFIKIHEIKQIQSLYICTNTHKSVFTHDFHITWSWRPRVWRCCWRLHTGFRMTSLNSFSGPTVTFPPEELGVSLASDWSRVIIPALLLADSGQWWLRAVTFRPKESRVQSPWPLMGQESSSPLSPLMGRQWWVRVVDRSVQSLPEKGNPGF